MKSLYKKTSHNKSDINTKKQLRQGTSIEEVMRLNTANKETPVAILPELYQQRSEGIDPLCDIRTDKFLMAEQAMDKVTRVHLLARNNKEKLKAGNTDNSWITDENGKPMYEQVTKTE